MRCAPSNSWTHSCDTWYAAHLRTLKSATEMATKKATKGKPETKSSKNGAKPSAQQKVQAAPEAPKRKLGLRGAAPWAARHAAKHAAEARARAAEPPPPGSARATIRTPSDVDAIKQHIGELHNAVEKLRSLRKNLPKTFFDIGTILRDIQA